MKIVRFYKLRKKIDTIVAYFDIEFNGLRINGFSFRTRERDFFIGVPKGSKSGGYVPIIEFTSKEVEDDLLNVVKTHIENKNIAVKGDERQAQIKEKINEESKTPKNKICSNYSKSHGTLGGHFDYNNRYPSTHQRAPTSRRDSVGSYDSEYEKKLMAVIKDLQRQGVPKLKTEESPETYIRNNAGRVKGSIDWLKNT